MKMPSAEEYLAASPFPHAVLDNLFPAELVSSAEAEFPDWRHDTWLRFRNRRELKGVSNDVSVMGPSTKELIHLLCRREMCLALEEMTGIQGLIPDLHGGGMHISPRNGRLAIHVDFNRGVNGYRRLNGLLFLNSSWRESWGGDLELWSKDRKVGRKISPIANRFAIFTTSDESFHGHPSPMTCPANRFRKSLAVYYFTKESPKATSVPHGTVFLKV